MREKERIIQIFLRVLEDRYGTKFSQNNDIIASHLEEICYTTAPPNDRVAYLQYVSEFVSHISPDFYTGNHCFTFHEMIIRSPETGLKNWLKSDRNYLYPEIHNNRYLSGQEYSDLKMIEIVELRKAFLIIERLITFQSEPIVFVNEMKRVQNYVCFSKNNNCWSLTDNNIFLECNENEIGCKKDLFTESSESKQCVKYKNFLLTVAGEEDMVWYGEALNKIHKKWSKEIKMAKVYLNILESIKK